MDLKKSILKDFEKSVRGSENAVFATNTSALSITELASVSAHPENVVGMHFFQPVKSMQLVECIRGKHTSDRALAVVYAHALALGKVPVIVGDGPGFLVNRLLGAYMASAIEVLTELGGSSMGRLERVMLKWGMPMGPFALIDMVGWDVAQHVADTLEGGLGARFGSMKADFDRLVDKKTLGNKTGRGFFLYEKPGGKKQGANMAVLSKIKGAAKRKSLTDADVIDRMVLAMVNEAGYMLEEGVAFAPEDVDLAMILGAGVAPFRGGPLQYADSRGLPAVVARLSELASANGARYAPSPLLVRMARGNETFFQGRPKPTAQVGARAARL